VGKFRGFGLADAGLGEGKFCDFFKGFMADECAVYARSGDV
jgi:hypothetical protein